MKKHLIAVMAFVALAVNAEQCPSQKLKSLSLSSDWNHFTGRNITNLHLVTAHATNVVSELNRQLTTFITNPCPVHRHNSNLVCHHARYPDRSPLALEQNEMETRNQIMYGLGAFLAGAGATALLVNALLFAFPTAAEYLVPRMFLGIFLFAWWVSYLAFTHGARKRKSSRRPESR